MFTQKRLFIPLVVFSWLMCFEPIHAQTSQINIPITSPTFIRWSHDSHYLTAAEDQGGIVSINEPYWMIFDMQTRTIQYNQTYSFTPSLTDQEVQVFGINRLTSHTYDRIIFESPNHRFIVYAGVQYTDSAYTGFDVQTWRLMIADRSTLDVVETNTTIYSTSEFSTFIVLWSADSSAFFMLQYGTDEYSPPPLYMTNFNNDIHQYKIYSQFDEFTIDGSLYRAQSYYDLSSNGRYIAMSSKNTNTLKEILIIYDIDTNIPLPLTGIQGDQVYEAKFLDNINHKMLIVCNLGLVLYDIPSQNWIVINPTIANFAGPISPNGEWLAYADGNSIKIVRIIDIDWPHVLVSLTPLATATPTLTPTLTNTPTSTATSTSTPSATPTLAPTSTAGMLRLQYYPDPGRRSITVDSLEPDFRIMNPTGSAIPLSEFKIRYYFTKEGTAPSPPLHH